MTFKTNLLLASMFCLAAAALAQEGPRPLPKFDTGIMFARLHDGTMMGVLQGPATVAGKTQQMVSARYSKDNGTTWSAPEPLFPVPAGPGSWGAGEVLVDRDNEVHVFFTVGGSGLKAGGEGERPLIGELTNARIDIGYVRSSNGRKTWSKPRVLWIGYTGALNSVIQMKSGRILLPFSYLTKRSWGNRGGGLAAFTFMGQYNCTDIYSDDGGATWKLGTDLMVPVPDIVSAYGAVEPVVVELPDGRVWNLMRTQNGRFWESFSTDGANWTEPRPTSILSSDSPAGLVRLNDGRIVLFWNNSLRYPYAYGGRQVLHAAISEDMGKTWRGFREVGRDPFRNEAPPSNQDYGTAYPFPVLANDNKILFVSGQGADRVLRMILDPKWLYETRQTADFKARAEEWSTFGTKGVSIVSDPEKPESRVLDIRKTEEGWPAAAVWNFPAGAKGKLELSIQIRPGFGGALIGLTDHFSTPFDMEDQFYNVHNLWIPADGRLSSRAKLVPGRWHKLALEWDAEKQNCRVLLDGTEALTLPVVRASRNVSYVRLRATAEKTDRAGFMVRSVVADVRPTEARSATIRRRVVERASSPQKKAQTGAKRATAVQSEG